MDQQPTSVSHNNPLIQPSTLNQASGNNQAAMKTKRLIPKRKAPPPPQKALNSRSICSVSPKLHLQITKDTDVKSLGKQVFDTLIANQPEHKDFTSGYRALVAIKQDYQSPSAQTLSNLHEQFPTLSEENIKILSDNIADHIDGYIADFKTQHVSKLSTQQAPESLADQLVQLNKIKLSIKQRTQKNNTVAVHQAKRHLQDSLHLSKQPETITFTAIEQMLIKEVHEDVINKNDLIDEGKQPQASIRHYQHIAKTYEVTEEGMDDDAHTDIESGLIDAARKYSVSLERLPLLTTEVARKTAQHFEQRASRIDWQQKRTTTSDKVDTNFISSLEHCSSPEELQQTASLWANEHGSLTPPEEIFLQKAFESTMSHILFHSLMLSQIPEQQTAQRTATLARLITQMQEDPELTQQVLRSHCKNHQKLLEMAGMPTYTQGPKMQQAMKPLITTIYSLINTKALNMLATNINEICKQKHIKGERFEAVAKELNLTKQYKIHKKDLMDNAKNKLDKASPKQKKELLTEIDNKLVRRAQLFENIVRQAMIAGNT